MLKADADEENSDGVDAQNLLSGDAPNEESDSDAYDYDMQFARQQRKQTVRGKFKKLKRRALQTLPLEARPFCIRCLYLSVGFIVGTILAIVFIGMRHPPAIQHWFPDVTFNNSDSYYDPYWDTDTNTANLNSPPDTVVPPPTLPPSVKIAQHIGEVITVPPSPSGNDDDESFVVATPTVRPSPSVPIVVATPTVRPSPSVPIVDSHTETQTDTGTDANAKSTPLCEMRYNPTVAETCSADANKPLPLPSDRPIEAAIQCQENVCTPALDGVTIMTGNGGYGTMSVLELDSTDTPAIDVQCLKSDELSEIKLSHLDYTNNEDHITCIHLRNSDNPDTNPILHVHLSLTTLDIETGYDNLFLTYQQDDFLDDYVHTWTGNTIADNEGQFWWNTKRDALSFTQICLRFQSDESVTSKGWEATVKIRKESGKWTEWSDCYNTHGGCGIGIHHRTMQCLPEKKSIDNDTHFCDHNYTTPNEFCLIADCGTFNNTKWSIQHGGKAGNIDRNLYNANGASRVDPTYEHPFALIANPDRTTIDLSYIRDELQKSLQSMIDRYPDKEVLKTGMTTAWPTAKPHYGLRLLQALLLGRKFTAVFTGSSNTAGHDNVFMSGYPIQLQSILRPLFRRIGVRGAGFRSRNSAVGGHLGTFKLGWCISALLDSHDKNLDMVSWESQMNDGRGIAHVFPEIWLRNAIGDDTANYNPMINCMAMASSIEVYYGEFCNPNRGNGFIFNAFIDDYASHNDTAVVSLHSTRPCDKVNATKYHNCKNLANSWHPSPHGHRVIAENYAISYLNATLNVLTKHWDEIKAAIAETNGRPSYALACLFDKWGTNKFHRPLRPGVNCGEWCEKRFWCTTSFSPTPEHSQLRRFATEITGFDRSMLDTPNAGMVIARKGGRESNEIPHVQLMSFEVGSTLVVSVKVPKRFIFIVYGQNQERWHVDVLLSGDYYVDGTKQNCLNLGVNYDDITDEVVKTFTTGGKNLINAGCLLEATAGKHELKVVHARKLTLDDNKYDSSYRIDMIAGL